MQEEVLIPEGRNLNSLDRSRAGNDLNLLSKVTSVQESRRDLGGEPPAGSGYSSKIYGSRRVGSTDHAAITPNTYSRRGEPAMYGVSRFGEGDKSALLESKRREYQQAVADRVEGQGSCSLDTSGFESKKSDLNHSISITYPGYDRQPAWIKNVVTEHCQYKA